MELVHLLSGGNCCVWKAVSYKIAHEKDVLLKYYKLKSKHITGLQIKRAWDTSTLGRGALAGSGM